MERKAHQSQKEYRMKRMDYKEGCDRLRQAGFSAWEIEQLSLLRTDYTEQEIYRKMVASSPLRHARWFERIIQKLLERCRHLVFPEDGFWAGD